MRYQFIEAERKNYSLAILCRVLQVSRSGYYEWGGVPCGIAAEPLPERRRPKSKRATENQRIVEQIKMFHCGSRCTYGSPRIHAEFKTRGEKVGENRIAKLMRINGIRGKCKRKFQVTTQSKHTQPIAENHLQQQFEASKPDQKWTGDITYIWTWEGWLYLAVVLDLYSRRVIGWAMSHTITDDLTLDALKMALRRSNHSSKEERLFHSDRGSQYASYDFRAKLAHHQITQSMSRIGNCYDNAVVESFFATLKTEEVSQHYYQTRQQARSSIFSYIEGFYNPIRRHSANGNLSPLDFEKHYWQNTHRAA